MRAASRIGVRFPMLCGHLGCGCVAIEPKPEVTAGLHYRRSSLISTPHVEQNLSPKPTLWPFGHFCSKFDMPLW